MSWAQSLIRLSTYEVEVLQKRLGEIAERRMMAQMKLAALDEEGRMEAIKATQDASAGWYHIGFADGLRARKAAAQATIDALAAEELGARDALNQAFESQKKYEHVAETARVLQMKEVARRESAMLDEISVRRAAVG